MASVDVLLDLPMAWLYRLSTSLTAASAARLRSTCKLLREVVDATWEPVEVAVPPHRRSVPLTFEQVQAQLPPQEAWEPDDDECDKLYYHLLNSDSQDGVAAWVLDVFGPALTRLTANQAVNTLKGKAVLCWLNDLQRNVDKASTAADRMGDLHQLHFPQELKDRQGRIVQWPPPANMCESDSECECECQGRADDDIGPGRGEAGWGDGRYPYHEFVVDDVTPEPLRGIKAQNPHSCVHVEPFRVYIYSCRGVYNDSLLVTTSNSCREATAAEVDEFEWPSAATDDSRFDFYLSHGREQARTYVFLAPFELRLTGRVKPVTSRLSGACVPPTAAAGGTAPPTASAGLAGGV